MRFDRARQIADAVLLEGYALYPYRASATKNRWRWSFGVLAPRAWSEAGGCEAWWMEAQVLVEAGDRPPRLRGRLRFLQAARRDIEAADGAAFRRVESLDAGARRLVPWDEGDIREITLPDLLAAGASTASFGFEVPGSTGAEPVRSPTGVLIGRTVRTSRSVAGLVRMSSEPGGEGGALRRIRVRIENVTAWEVPGAPRDEALAASCIGVHLLLGVEDGAFVSLIDPPGAARAAAAACKNVRTFPVLAGEPGERDLVLCAPFILYDHPRIAPESPGDLFDATEIDEILTLRTATLTPDEKREARGTDPRVAALLDRIDALPPETMERLHGALRELRGAEMVPRSSRATSPPSPLTPALSPRWCGGRGRTSTSLRPGDRVRLRAPSGRTDAQDLLYAGRTATVRQVREDVDGRVWLAVTIDGDPAAELHDWYGRYHHYAEDEVEPIAPVEEARP
jgi:hypothetical protein